MLYCPRFDLLRAAEVLVSCCTQVPVAFCASCRGASAWVYVCQERITIIHERGFKIF